MRWPPGLPFTPNYWTTLITSATASGLFNVALPVAAATLQIETPNRMRGMVSSLYALVLTGAGLGLSPTAIALVTDHVVRDPAKVGISLGGIVGLAAFGSLPWLASSARYLRARYASTGGSRMVQ